MGRSPASSCLRIIVCAGRDDDAAEPTANALPNKSSGDNRRWSFRKKSGKKRGGLITSVVSDTTPVSRTRETLESALLKSPSPDHNNLSEKQTFSVGEKNSQLSVTYVAEPMDEKKTRSSDDKTELPALCLEEQIGHRTELPIIVESKGTEAKEDDLIRTESQAKLEGANAAVAAVTEKDSASEIETAYKVEPKTSETETDDDVLILSKISDEDVDEKLDDSVIIYIQAAIRGFLVRREILKRKKVVKLQAAVRGHLVRNQAMGSLRCVQAIVKMQNMVRARHSTKDGSRILDKEETNASAQKLLQNKFAKHLMESTPKTKPISIKCDVTKSSSAWNWLERWMSVSKPDKTSKPDLASEGEQIDLVNSDSTPETKNQTALSSNEASKVEMCAELTETEKMSQHDAVEASAEVDCDGDLIKSRPVADKDPVSEPDYADEQSKHSLKREASNSYFVDAQSKFEELTSCAGSNKATMISSKQCLSKHSLKREASNSAYVDAQSNFEVPTSCAGPNQAMMLSSKDAVLGEESQTNIESPKQDHYVEGVAIAELGGSEYGTELSVTSSLDTLDKKADLESADSKVEAKLLENGPTKTGQAGLIETDVKDGTPLSTVEDTKEKVEILKDEIEISATHDESVITTPDSKKRRAEDESGPLPEEALTPMTMTESQETPISEATSSIKARKGKSEKSGSSQKRKVSKKITSSEKQESGTGETNNTTEQEEEGREQKSMRRKSFGYDQEARESSGGKNSLPRFMQPTQSAKAKVQEHNSPRSSPDLQEREKKRHSLPVVANGSSPRIQQSATQPQQGTKDRKWQR